MAILQFQKWGALWGQCKCLSCMGIFYVNQKNLNANSTHNFGDQPMVHPDPLRIATVATRLPLL